MIRKTHSNETRAGTINIFGCGKADCIRANHHNVLCDMCVADRGATPGILGGRGRITSRPKKEAQTNLSEDPSASRIISTADGPRARIAPTSEETKQEGRAVECGAGLDAEPGATAAAGGSGGGVRGCRPFSPLSFHHGTSAIRYTPPATGRGEG